MKKYIKIASVFAVAAVLASCHKDIIIPDPGFDMSETVLDTVLRDTSTTYHIAFNVKAPNGVRTIELLDGRTFESIMEFGEYAGKHDFEFSHVFDLSGCDPERDSMLVYNIKIRTNDNRGYNKSIRILHVRKSHPEIVGPESSTMNFSGNTFVFDANVTAGFYQLKEIKATLEGEEVLNVGEAELNGAGKYHLYQKLSKDFDEGKSYSYSIYVKYSKNEEKVFTYSLVKNKLKRPVGLRASRGSSQDAVILHYNENDQVEWIWDVFMNNFVVMHYDEHGRMTTRFRTSYSTLGDYNPDSPYGYGSMATWFQYNEDGSLNRFVDFGYTSESNGVVHKLLDPFWNRPDLIPESCSMDDIVGTDREGFITSINAANDKSMNVYTEHNGKKYITEMTGTNTNHIGPFTYIEDFEDGGLLHAFIPGYGTETAHPFAGFEDTDWAKISAYSSARNPLYVKDFPLEMQLRYCGYWMQQLFGCKYAISSVRQPYYRSAPDEDYMIPYTVREDGLLKSFKIMASVVDSYEDYTITYYYDDEPDTWKSIIDPEVEELGLWLK